MRAAVSTALVATAIVAAAGFWVLATREPDQILPDRIAEARSLGKPMIVEFGADNCAACREMKSVLSDLEATYGDQLTIIDVEYGSTEGRQVQKAYRLIAIPTQVFFAADGKELGRHMGAIPIADIAVWLGLESVDAS